MTSNKDPQLVLLISCTPSQEISLLTPSLPHTWMCVCELENLPPDASNYHPISTSPSSLLFSKVRLLNTEKLIAAKKKFLEMEGTGIIRRLNSLGQPPLHGEEEEQGLEALWGLLASQQFHYSRPLMHMADKRHTDFFSNIDLNSGYNQVPMHCNAIPLTTVITLLGLWERYKIPNRLQNSSSTFHRMMHAALGGPAIHLYIHRRYPDFFYERR